MSPDKKGTGKYCFEIGQRVRDDMSTHLWFNARSFSEHGVLIESILNEYSEKKYPDLNLNWRSVSEHRPYRKVAFTGYYLPDPEDTENLDKKVLMLANGLPNRGFQFTALRIDGGYEFRFEARSIPYDNPLVRFLYSNALESLQCTDNLPLTDAIYKNTELKVEKNNLTILTRLTKMNLAQLRDLGAL